MSGVLPYFMARRRLLAGGGGGSPSDPHWSSVVLLVAPNAPDGTTTFTDLSNSAHSLTARGTAQVLDNRMEFAGSDDSIRAPDHLNWRFDADFTVELFGVEFDSVTGRRGLIGQWVAPSHRSWAIDFRGDATPDDLMFLYSTSGSTASAGPVYIFTPTIGQSYNIAVDRSGTTTRLYVDGIWRASVTISGSLFNSTDGLDIGQGSFKASDALDGRISAARITKGVARYATDTSYTVPSLPLPTS